MTNKANKKCTTANNQVFIVSAPQAPHTQRKLGYCVQCISFCLFFSTFKLQTQFKSSQNIQLELESLIFRGVLF